MQNNKTIHLPISTNYVNHWGFWDATREILQNAIDTKDFKVTKMESSGILKIESYAGKLDLASLMLGESSKRDDTSTIGKFGEGYKLALLVLCREGYEVLIKNGHDCWRVKIEKHPQMGVECLAIEIIEGTYSDEDDDAVSFIINGLESQHFNLIRDNFIDPNDVDPGFTYGLEVIAENKGSYCLEIPAAKKVFVGGLFVCDLGTGYHYSYNFSPDVLPLDRDRNKVESFYLQKEATSILANSGNIEILIELASQKAKDVSDYYTVAESRGSFGSSEGYEKATVDIAIKAFVKSNGDKAYPINESETQERIKLTSERCVDVGLVPVLVKPLLFDILKIEYKDKLGVQNITGKISDAIIAITTQYKGKIAPVAAKALNSLALSVRMKGS